MAPLDWNKVVLVGTVKDAREGGFTLVVHGEEFRVRFMLPVEEGQRVEVRGRVRPDGTIDGVLVKNP